MRTGLAQRLRSCQIEATSSTSVDLREPLEDSGFLPLKEYLPSRGKPMNEYKQNFMSKSINHTYGTPNGL